MSLPAAQQFLLAMPLLSHLGDCQLSKVPGCAGSSLGQDLGAEVPGLGLSLPQHLPLPANGLRTWDWGFLVPPQPLLCGLLMLHPNSGCS